MGKVVVEKKYFGTLSSGEDVSLFTVSNGKMLFSAIDFGACITSIQLPRKNGIRDEITLGYSTLDGYARNKPHFGGLIGRYAGRIAQARFTLNGTEYQLAQGKGGHCLHSGFPCYDKLMWKADVFTQDAEAGIHFYRTSPQGEQGFPGEADVHVYYSLTDDDRIRIRYDVSVSEPTPINLTNHTYFNLNLPAQTETGSLPTVLNHELAIFTKDYVDVDARLLPTGKTVAVAGTPFDFTQSKLLSADFDQLENGFDGTWLFSDATSLKKMACLSLPALGRSLTVYSTQPALTMYTANFLQNEPGRLGLVYGPQSAICLESQHVPNSPNIPVFPSTIVHPDAPYQHQTEWRFTF